MTAKFKLRVLLLLAPLIYTYTPTRSYADSVQDSKILICATLPLSGEISFYGLGFKNAAELALKDMGLSDRYTLKFDDNSGSTIKAVASFQKLVNLDHCKIVLSATANIALALAPLARQKQIVHLGVSSDPIFAEGVNNFNIWPAPEIPVRKLLEQFKKRNLKNIGLIGLEHAWPRAIFKELESSLKSANMSVTMQEYFLPEEMNYRPILERLRRSNSDIAVLLSWSPNLEIFARQYHELKIPIPLTCDFAFEASQDRSLFEGMWFVNLRGPDSSYREKFKIAYGYYPYAQMELGDVMTRLAVRSFESVGKDASADALAKYFLAVRNQASIIGPISMKANGTIEAPYRVKIIEKGVIVENAE